MALEKELEVFRKMYPIWLNQFHGRFALIHGEEFDTWCCYDDAMKVGYQKYGLEPFLVKRIEHEFNARCVSI
jgi:hypothetical protein